MDKFRIAQKWANVASGPVVLIKDKAGLLRSYPYLAEMLKDIDDGDFFRISWTVNEYAVEIEMIADEE